MKRQKTLKSRLSKTLLSSNLFNEDIQNQVQQKVQRVKKQSQKELEEIRRETEIQIEQVKKQAAADKERLELSFKAQVPGLVENQVKDELFKADALAKKEAHQYRYPERINSNSDPERKPGSDVPFS